MGPDHATGFVRQHLRDRGAIAQQSDGVFIQSSPGTPGKIVSTVRRSMRERRWSVEFTVDLRTALLELPEAKLEPSPPGDMFTVVWKVPT